LRQLEIVALAMHADGDGADPAPRIEPRAERRERVSIEPEARRFQRNDEEPAALVEHGYSMT
jgi:hypothetical protein